MIPDPNGVLGLTMLVRGRGTLDVDGADNLGRWRPHARVYLDRRAFEEAFGASSSDLERVRAFAERLGVEAHCGSPASRIVRLTGPRAKLERALDSAAGGATRSGELDTVVQGVFGLDASQRASPRLITRHRVLAAIHADLVAGSYSPREVAALYGFPLHLAGDGERIGIIDFGSGPFREDLQKFFSSARLPIPEYEVVSMFPVAPYVDSPVEATMAIEIAGAIAHACRFVVYRTVPTEQGWVEGLRYAVHDDLRRPTVLMLTWGWPEHDWSQACLDAVNDALREASELGVTVVAASGNDGAVDDVDDGNPHVDFPAASPYVLACGGTSLRSMKGRKTSETVWNNGPLHLGGGASGGGVSTRIPRPDWQAAADVPSSPREGYDGRGVPDVAANADPNTGYRLVIDGNEVIGGGTSAATALWAALIACMNQATGRALGFLNPVIYTRLAALGAFEDVVVGSNDTTGAIGGYVARHGWNAATGWGTVRGTLLLDLLTDRREAKPSRSTVEALGARWQSIPGLAFDVAAADDGLLWVASTLPSGPFGSGIYHWNGATWGSIPGGGRRIAVGRGKLFATIATSRILVYERGEWMSTEAFAHDIAAGPDGSLWGVGTYPIAGGFPVYRWTASTQFLLPSKGGIRIAVGPDGHPWIVTYQLEVMTWTRLGWRTLPALPRRSPLVPGEGVDIGVGANGSVWVVSNPPEDEPSIFHWNGASWDSVPGAGVAVSVRPEGLPWVIAPSGEIYVRV